MIKTEDKYTVLPNVQEIIHNCYVTFYKADIYLIFLVLIINLYNVMPVYIKKILVCMLMIV